MPCLTFVVGKRESGKSRYVTHMIGQGDGSVVVVICSEQAKYHQSGSPNAKVCIWDGGSTEEFVSLCSERGVSRLVLDNVTFSDRDAFLKDALARLSPGIDMVITMCHPLCVPDSLPPNAIDASVLVVWMGSNYSEASTIPSLTERRMEKLKWAYPFQLHANTQSFVGSSV